MRLLLPKQSANHSRANNYSSINRGISLRYQRSLRVESGLSQERTRWNFSLEVSAKATSIAATGSRCERDQTGPRDSVRSRGPLLRVTGPKLSSVATATDIFGINLSLIHSCVERFRQIGHHLFIRRTREPDFRKTSLRFQDFPANLIQPRNIPNAEVSNVAA